MTTMIPMDGKNSIGDNLTNFEEYRGFFVRGVHRRTNPFHKDFFIDGTVFGWDIHSAYPALPTSTYSIDSTDATSAGIINPNHASLPGDSGHLDASSHVLINSPAYDPDHVASTYCGGVGLNQPSTPNDCKSTTIYAGTNS